MRDRGPTPAEESLRRRHSNRRNRRLPSDEESLTFQRFWDVSPVIVSTSNGTDVGLVCGHMRVDDCRPRARARVEKNVRRHRLMMRGENVFETVSIKGF